MKNGLSRLLDLVVAPAILLSLFMAFLYAPADKTMHDVYRIFYFHVPAAAASFLGFAIVFACSGLYLRTRSMRYDVVAAAAAEVGVVFCALGIGMGMLWAKPIWGQFWIPGDIHLVSTAVLFFIYIAYLMMRAAIVDPERRARLSALVGLVGIVGVPIVFFSIRVIHVGNHPVLLSLDKRMSLTFMTCMTSMLVFFLFVLVRRVRLGQAQAVLDDARDFLTLGLVPERATRITAGAARRVTVLDAQNKASASVGAHADDVPAII